MTRSQVRRHRIEQLIEKGIVQLDEIPNDWQIDQCLWAMFPLITQREYEDSYRPYDTWLAKMPQRGFAQFFLGVYFFDPTGLTRTKKGLIWHILGLNHLFAEGVCYDIEMIASMTNGAEDLESEAKAVIYGTHPQAWLLRQLAGSPDYHPMILGEARKAQQGQFTPSPPSCRVQTMLENCLSFPKTPMETLADSTTIKRLVDMPGQLLHNVVSALTNAPPPEQGKFIAYAFPPGSKAAS